jgi:hypothetical protein
MADLIKGRMERILDTIEKLLGPVQTARTEDVANIVEINYSSAWAELEGDISTVEWGLGFNQGDIGTANYQEGTWLLTTNWHQRDPYNQDCPAPPGDDDCTAARCRVGCVATAAAQIMRFWYWPPYGSGSPYGDTYDWLNMPDAVAPDAPAEQRNAVAELCHEVGIAVEMKYCEGDGCQSGAYPSDIEDLYEEHYRYSDACGRRDRSDYSTVDWFELIKLNLNANHPVQYEILGHSIVGDGWQEIYIGSTFTRQYHMNYGWGRTCGDPNGCNAWYTINRLFQADDDGTTDDESMTVNIYPVTSVRWVIAGTYPKEAFNYRYFDQNANGSSAVFEAGQNLQFMPNIRIASTGIIKFGGSSRFFTRGDRSRGIRTDSGGISMYSGGQMKLY